MTSTCVVDYSNLTSDNYKQFLGESIVEKIESYLEENFYIDDMIAFVQEYGDTAFCNHYDEYVEAGESNSYGAVDAFIEEFGLFQSREVFHHIAQLAWIEEGAHRRHHGDRAARI